MYCPKCGVKLNNQVKFCSQCGTLIKKDLHDSETKKDLKEDIKEEDLIKAYVGKNYDQLKTTKFSIPTFFFGIYYLLYRKMWLYALSLLALSIMCIIGKNLYGIKYLYGLVIIVNIIISLMFSKLYFKTVRKRIQKIKKLNYTSQQLLNECTKKGGVSIAAVIIYFIIIFLILLCMLFSIIEKSIEKIFNNSYKYTQDIQLNYEIPTIFEDSDYQSGSYKIYNYFKDFDSCSIIIKEYQAHPDKTADDYLRIDVAANNEILAKEINGNVWRYTEVEDSKKTEYYYYIIKNNHIYKVKYVIYLDNNKLCSEGYNKFINSLSFQRLSNEFDTI